MGWQSAEISYAFRRLWKRWARPVLQSAFALLIAFGAASLWLRATGQGVDFRLLQQFFFVRGKASPPKDVLLVAIDDLTYSELNLSPKYTVPRSILADALEKIVTAAPKLLVLDLRFPQERTIDPAGDARIVAALERGPTTIWTGEFPDDPDEFQPGVLIRSDEQFRKAAKLELPMSIAGVNGILGFLGDVSKSRDPLEVRIPFTKALQTIAGIKTGEPGPYDLINFYGPKGTISRLSLSTIIKRPQEEVNSLLAGKVLLLGYVSVNLGRSTSGKDEYPVTGSHGTMYGVEVHANIMGNLLERNWLKRRDPSVEYLSIIVLLIFTTGIGLRLKSLQSLIFLGSVSLGAVLFSYFEFAYNQRWTSGIGVVLLGILATVLLNYIHFLIRTKKFQRSLKRWLDFELDEEL